MEFSITEAMNGFIIEDKNGDKAVFTFARMQKSNDAPKPTPEQVSANSDAVISIIADKKGRNWVRVEALGEDFCIATEDINDRDNMTYDEAMEELKEVGVDTFDRKQGLIIAIYIEQINAKLKEAGGKPFAKDWYVSKELWRPVGSSADCDAYRAWCFNGGNGCFYYGNRSSSTFRSRPVLAYNALLN